MNSEPSFIEVGTPDATKARAFYETLFGWKFHDMGKGGSWADTGTMRAGFHNGDEDRRIVVYFATDDIEAAVRRVRELGGKAGDPGPETPGFGRFAECTDTQGVTFGLHQRPSEQR